METLDHRGQQGHREIRVLRVQPDPKVLQETQGQQVCKESKDFRATLAHKVQQVHKVNKVFRGKLEIQDLLVKLVQVVP
jgi:hypothetical protein